MPQLPTLLLPGNIVIKESYPDYVKNMTGIEFVNNFVGKILQNKSPKNIGEKVIILKAGTASGKSVSVAAFAMKLLKETDKSILVQPRVLTTISITKDIIKYNKGFTLGKNIGYVTGLLKKKPPSGLTVMTYGILLNQMLNSSLSDFARKYKILFLDEIHERQMDTDLIIYFLKKMLTDNLNKGPTPIVLIMSATFDPKLYMDYFNVPEDNFIEILGRSNPINCNYPKITPIDLDKYIIDTIKNIHINNIEDVNGNLRDIVVFVEGGARGERYVEAINMLNTTLLNKSWNKISKNKYKDLNTSKKYFLSPVMVTSSINQEGGERYNKIFSDINSYDEYLYALMEKKDKQELDMKKFTKIKASRKIYIGTNVMETGVTLAKLKYCIDTGYQNNFYFDPNLSSHILITANVTQDNALQRKGRVGRLGMGEWYPGYTENTFKKFKKTKFPDILVQDTTLFWLRLLNILSDINLEPRVGYNVDKEKVKKGLVFRKHILEDSTYYELIQNNDIDFTKLDLLTIPSISSIKNSLDKLHNLGFINYKYEILPLGYFIKNLRKISIESIRMLLSAYYYECNILQIITIIACIELFNKTSLFAGNSFNRTYQNPLNLPKEQHIFFTKYVVKDDLINYLFAWEKLENAIKENVILKKNYNLTVFIKDWCKENSIKFNSLLNLIYFRNEIIENLISTGINPFYNGYKIKNISLTKLLNIDYIQGIDEIKKIKQCILDGFRFNLLKLSYNERYYAFVYKERKAMLSTNLISKNDSIKPQYLITTDIVLSNARSKSGLFNYSTGRISILDDYLQVDEKFLFY